MEERKMTCIVCPLGCEVTVRMDGGKITDITGHSCKRGAVYATAEVTNPRRILTTTMRIMGGAVPLVSVKSSEPMPKGKLFDCMKAIAAAEASAPVRIGDVLIANIENTEANIVATCDVPCYNDSDGYREGDGMRRGAAPSQQQMAAV